jgi:hypothetical protein
MPAYTTLAARDAILKSSPAGPFPINSSEISEDSEVSDFLLPSFVLTPPPVHRRFVAIPFYSCS